MPNGKITIKDVYEAIESLECKIEKHYVSKAEFWPVKILVYGAVGMILTAVVGVLVSHAVQGGM